ncbi:MAG: SH3 domain-containing protein [Planctomycetota bacterium]
MSALRCHRSFLLFSLVLFGPNSLLWAEDDLIPEPYSVFVAQEAAYARCGPAGDYYRTDPLKHGQALEVYVETDDGWLGVRPPKDSFCWIPAESVELTGNDQGETIEDRTVAWIGTHLGRARKYRWQVQLAKGEPVTVIGRSEREGPDGPVLWYRIVPPNGEFRWVHRSQVVESSEQLVQALRQADQSGPSANQVQSSRQVRQAGGTDASDSLVRVAGSRGDSHAEKLREVSGDESKALRPLKKDEDVVLDRPIGSGLAEQERPDEWRDEEAYWQAKNQSSRRQARDERAGTSSDGPMVVQANATMGGQSGRRLQELQVAGTAKSLQQVRPDVVPNAAFVSQPRLLDIGSGLAESAPVQRMARDSSWVSGGMRRIDGSRDASRPHGALLASGGSMGIHSTPVAVSPTQIEAIKREAERADANELQLILSRLMASGATSPEVAPVLVAANRIATHAADELSRSRARLIVERVSQYTRVANRRDGNVLLASGTTTSGGISQASYQQTAGGQGVGAASGEDHDAASMPEGFIQQGRLVQVYSVRKNSPPFALTDTTGRTVAYVTPSPGVNLRVHLNNQIRVAGKQGYLHDVDLPHIVVEKAVRGRR